MQNVMIRFPLRQEKFENEKLKSLDEKIKAAFFEKI